jgi:arginine decarboxylase
MIDRFIDVEEDKHVLEVHEYRPNEPYFMGLFLNGAYQEILGDLHNLFGDTNAVHVRLTDEDFEVRHVVKGDNIADVLKYVEYQPDAMVESVRKQAERSVQSGKLTNAQMRTLMQHYEQALRSYTYLTDSE